MSGRNKLYLALDITIAAAFVLSLATGLVWLLSTGGRSGLAPLGVDRGTWSSLHTWFSLVMIAGAIVHLALHWGWIVSLTQRLREGRAKKARWNYVFDWVLGLTLVVATLTGLAFLVDSGGGYQGGRNLAFSATFWGIGRETWSDLHAWFGLGFLAVLVVHQALHWASIKHTTGRVVQLAAPRMAGLRPGEVAVRAGEQ